MGNEAGIEHQRYLVKCVQPPRGIQLTIREQMAVGRVQHTFGPAPTASPSKGNRPGARTDRDAMSDDVVLRQFLRLEPMPLDGDAAPSERAAAQQHGSSGRARESLTVRDVDECDVTRVRKAHRRDRRAARTVGQAPTSLAPGRLRRIGRLTHRASVGRTPDSWISTGGRSKACILWRGCLRLVRHLGEGDGDHGRRS